MSASGAGDVTVDSFHRGGFSLVQPRHKGHRAGMDAMVLAAAVPGDFPGHVVDLGAGAGAAGLAVAARCARARATLVERAPEMADCARQSLALAENGGLAERVNVLEADVTLAGRERTAAGLADRAFDFAITNPPFNAPGDRATPDALKRFAHVLEDGLLERWIKTAAAVVGPRGGLALIARPALLQPVLSALGGRFGSAGIVPVHPRADADAIRIVVRATRGARGGPRLCPPLVLHENGRAFTARAEAIANGEASLFGD